MTFTGFKKPAMVTFYVLIIKFIDLKMKLECVIHTQNYDHAGK
jgi:hypothetical protein